MQNLNGQKVVLWRFGERSSLTMSAAKGTHTDLPAESDTEGVKRAARAAVESERRRIGQELHDHLCQQLLGAAFVAKGLADGLEPGSTAAAEADALARLINAAVQETRDIARGLFNRK
ncbi:MAG: histidine kinase [Chthoniobacteraceae bacterium]